MPDYPLGRKGTIIGTPYHGTHTLGNWQSDNAIDIKVPVGTPVYAVTAGTIGPRIGAFNTSNPRFAGLRLTLTGGGNSFYYAHLSRLAVQAGETVTAGQLLGYSGEANGVAHLHFAVEKGTPGDVVRGAPIPQTQAATEAPAPAAPAPAAPAGVPTVTPPPLAAPVGVTPELPQLPGTQGYTLDHQEAAATWQPVAQLQEIGPNTQRLLDIAGGLGGG